VAIGKPALLLRCKQWSSAVALSATEDLKKSPVPHDLLDLVEIQMGLIP
jgi:hypothetical protein